MEAPESLAEPRGIFYNKGKPPGESIVATPSAHPGSGPQASDRFELKISLGQWSLHKALFAGRLTTLDFPAYAKDRFGIAHVEYVTQFFPDKAEDEVFLAALKRRCDEHGVESVLLMVDGEGSLADADSAARKRAVENHFKWVAAAALLGCGSIRVNLHGVDSAEEWQRLSVDSLAALCAFGAAHRINILVENHGGLSSNGRLLAEVVRRVGSPYCGTLPDFGNFCLRREKGDLWESPCVEQYDRYRGVEEMLPYAKGLSAKSLRFDPHGNETTIDFRRMLDLAKAAGYNGCIGIEYEGEDLGEDEGIRATIALLEKSRSLL
jgi:L-ribulose-5-phosphate 3-epimerase